MKKATLLTAGALTACLTLVTAVPALVRAFDPADTLRTQLLGQVDGQIDKTQSFVDMMHERTSRTTSLQRADLQREFDEELSMLATFKQSVVDAPDYNSLAMLKQEFRYTLLPMHRFTDALNQQFYWTYTAQTRKDSMEGDLENTNALIQVARAKGKSTGSVRTVAKQLQTEFDEVQGHIDAAATALAAAGYDNGVADADELAAIRAEQAAANMQLSTIKASIKDLRTAVKAL